MSADTVRAWQEAGPRRRRRVPGRWGTGGMGAGVRTTPGPPSRPCPRAESGQMAVELAVLVPVVIVVGLTIFNLMRFVELCAAFDRIALDAVVSQGVSPAGELSEHAATGSVQSCIEAALDSELCEVTVVASSPTPQVAPGHISFPISPLLTEYECTLIYHTWPGSFVIAGVPYASPVVLRHSRSLVVDRFRPGVVV